MLNPFRECFEKYSTVPITLVIKYQETSHELLMTGVYLPMAVTSRGCGLNQSLSPT